MEYTTLGRSGIEVPRLGFGCDPMSGHAWGQVDGREAQDAIAFALDHGMTLFDTADVYGLGRSESMLGTALKGRRDRAVIATKFGVRVENGKTGYDNSPAWIRTALDASLRRLGTDHVDLYQLHYWDGRTDLADIIDVLVDLRQKGKVRAWGVTNVPISNDLVTHAGDGLVSFSYEYSLANRQRETEIKRTVERHGVTFLSWGSLGQGVLTGKYGAGHEFDADDRRSRPTYVNFSAEGRQRSLRVVGTMREIQSRNPSRSLAQIALRWILDRIPGSVALVGIKRTSQIDDAAGALGWTLSPEEIDRLDAISQTAPTSDQASDDRTFVQARV